MKRLLAAAALALLALPAYAQQTPVGQSPGGAISYGVYRENSDQIGFNDSAIALLTVPATSTTQATFNAATGAVATGTVILARTTIITACSATTGATLPALQVYLPVSLMNRSGGSCLIWPTLGTTLETAPGTDAAINAPFTMLTNTNVVFRAVPTAANGVKWMQ
jgi:hypothetical protein